MLHGPSNTIVALSRSALRGLASLALAATAPGAFANWEAQQQLILTESYLTEIRVQAGRTPPGMVSPAGLQRRWDIQTEIFYKMYGDEIYVETWENNNAETRERAIEAYKQLTKDALKQAGFAVLKNAGKFVEQAKKFPIGSKARQKIDKLLADKNFQQRLDQIEKGAEATEEALGRYDQFSDIIAGDADMAWAIKQVAGEIPGIGDLIGFAETAAGYGNAFADTGSSLMNAAAITEMRAQIARNREIWHEEDQRLRRTEQALDAAIKNAERLIAYRKELDDSAGLAREIDAMLDSIGRTLESTDRSKYRVAAASLKAQRVKPEPPAPQKPPAPVAEPDVEQEFEALARQFGGTSCGGWFPDFFTVRGVTAGSGRVSVAAQYFESQKVKREPGIAGGDAALFRFGSRAEMATNDKGESVVTGYFFYVQPVQEDSAGTLLVRAGPRACTITANRVSVSHEGMAKLGLAAMTGGGTSVFPVPDQPLTVSIRVNGGADMARYRVEWSARGGAVRPLGGFAREGGVWVAKASVTPGRAFPHVGASVMLGDRVAFAFSNYHVDGQLPHLERLILSRPGGSPLAPGETLRIAIPNDRGVAGINLLSEAMMTNAQKVSPSLLGTSFGFDAVSIALDRPAVADLSLPVGVNSHSIGIAPRLGGRTALKIHYRPDRLAGRSQELVHTWPVLITEFSLVQSRSGERDMLRLAAVGPDEAMTGLSIRWVGAPAGQAAASLRKAGNLWQTGAIPAEGVTAVEVRDSARQLLTALDVAARLAPSADAGVAAGAGARPKPGVVIRNVTNLAGNNPLHTGKPALNFGGRTFNSVADLVQAASGGLAGTSSSTGSVAGCVKTVTMNTVIAPPSPIYGGNFDLNPSTLQCTTQPPGIVGSGSFSITDAPGDATNTAYNVGTGGWNTLSGTYAVGGNVSFNASSSNGRQVRVTFRVTRNSGGAAPSTLQIVSIDVLN